MVCGWQSLVTAQRGDVIGWEEGEPGASRATERPGLRGVGACRHLQGSARAGIGGFYWLVGRGQGN